MIDDCVIAVLIRQLIVIAQRRRILCAAQLFQQCEPCSCKRSSVGCAELLYLCLALLADIVMGDREGLVGCIGVACGALCVDGEYALIHIGIAADVAVSVVVSLVSGGSELLIQEICAEEHIVDSACARNICDELLVGLCPVCEHLFAVPAVDLGLCRREESFLICEVAEL